MNIKKYYKNPDVRKRIIEYLGGDSPENATSIFIRDCSNPTESAMELKNPTEINYYFKNGMEIARSLWDKNSLIVHLDIEYVNFDFPAEPFLNPLRTFALQQPIETGIERILLQYGIKPLHLLSGRGHHFVWQINKKSAVYERLTRSGRLSEHEEAYYSNLTYPANKKIEPDLGKAFNGLGLVLEYLAVRIQAEINPLSDIPVEITDIMPGPQIRGREIVVLDISEYGDPLNTRMIRIPFTVYLKPWLKKGIIDKSLEHDIPVMFPVPLYEMDTEKGLMTMRNAEAAAELAARAPVKIPDQTDAMMHCIDDYLSSDLRQFHDFYYSEEHESSEHWMDTYDRTPLDELPDCISHILKYPNPLLEEPAGIRQVVRSMLSLGWHPRHIAGLIRSKYERDFGWGSEWYIYDAGMRSDFYTRLFSGLLATGYDDMIDFNCHSTKERGLCFNQDNMCNIDDFRISLSARRNYERLASRPFNRLFL